MCFEPDSSPPIPVISGAAVSHEELALRFAERKHVAIAIDYFGRTAGVAKRDDDFDYMPHVRETKPGLVQEDVGAGVRHVRSLGCTSIFTVGFCFGGRNSWLAAASGHGLKGAIGFYGNPVESNGVPGPAERAAEIEAPILALQAGDDGNIGPEKNAAFDAALTAAGVEHELVVYEGAPHSFFDRKQEQFADDSDDAWRRVLDFVGRYR